VCFHSDKSSGGYKLKSVLFSAWLTLPAQPDMGFLGHLAPLPATIIQRTVFAYLIQ
jgi:hypothetical protein